MNEQKTAGKICTLCGVPASRVYEGMSGYVEGTRYDVYECERCRSSFVDPMSNLKDEYDVIYGKENIKDSVYNYYYYLARGVKRLRRPLEKLSAYTAIYWGVMKALKDNHVSNGAKILEVGSGLGYFTYALREAGYEARGLEYSDTAVSFANNFFGNHYEQGTIESYSATHGNLYDVVIATEVIEHVENPVSFIGSFLNVLKPGGKIIITTPNKDVHPRGTIWETDYAPKHLWWFTKNGLCAVAEHFGKSFQETDFTEYKKHHRYTIPVGVAYAAPALQPIVDAKGAPLRTRRLGYKERLMRLIPPAAYIKLVCLYHKAILPGTQKPKDGSMYIICGVITK